MNPWHVMTGWMSVAVLLLFVSQVLAQDQSEADDALMDVEQTVVVEQTPTTSDPTQASSRLLEAMDDEPVGGSRRQAAALRLPAIQLKARVLVKNKPPVIVLQIGTKYYQARPGASLLVDAGQGMMELQIKTINADEVRIDLPELKRTLTLN